MAVYKRDYKPYEERRTPGWSRFLVLPRYLFQDVFASRIITIFFIVSFMPFLGAMLLVYLRYNVKALEIFELPVQLRDAQEASGRRKAPFLHNSHKELHIG